jgi:hypothetical protein
MAPTGSFLVADMDGTSPRLHTDYRQIIHFLLESSWITSNCFFLLIISETANFE